MATSPCKCTISLKKEGRNPITHLHMPAQRISHLLVGKGVLSVAMVTNTKAEFYERTTPASYKRPMEDLYPTYLLHGKGGRLFCSNVSSP